MPTENNNNGNNPSVELQEARNYHAFSREPRLMGFEFLARNYDLISQLPYSATALDLGCGPGDVTKLLAMFPNLNQIVALDFKPNMIQLSNELNSDGRVVYHLSDICKLETWPKVVSAKESIDLVTAFASLHLVDDPFQALQNIHHSLKVGGLMLGHVPVQQHPINKLQEFLTTQAEEWITYFKDEEFYGKPIIRPAYWFDSTDESPAQTFIALLKKCGFLIRRLCLNTVPITSREDELRGTMALLISKYVNCIPEEKREQFLNACFECYAEQFERQGDLFIYDKHNWILQFACCREN